MSDVGLRRRSENDEEFSMMVRSLPALASCHQIRLEMFPNQLSDAFPGEDVQDFDQITEFRLYSLISGTRPFGLSQACAVHCSDMEPHSSIIGLFTTNCVEGFHNALMPMFLCKHPAVWVLFKALRRDIGVACYILQQSRVQNNANRLNIYRNIEVRL